MKLSPTVADVLRHLLLVLPFCATSHAAEFGDQRDKPGEVQVLRVPENLIPSSAPRSPGEELQSFQVDPGFKIELVACEPLVQDPVVAQFAPDGKLWVVEMRGFMAAMDGKGEELPMGRVAVLEDTDHDGRMDRSTVFVDGLVLPRALLLVGDGALVGAPPKLWYFRDTNGDGAADEKTEVASDFGWANNPQHPELGNPEQAANSLVWAMDNWIYAAHYTRKYRLEKGAFSAGVTTFRGQWGLAQDDDGHLYYNSNQDPLRVDILPASYTGRNPNYEPCGGTNVQVYADQLVWPIRVNPGVNRGYRDGILRENGRLKEFTAACAPHIYRGGAFGSEFEGNPFICEPAGNLIKREIMTARHGMLTCRDAYDQREFLASTDERFRPVNLTTGPDGALYVTDLYRGVLQHRESFTTYLRTYSEQRGLDKPLHLGRIWRVAPPTVKPFAKMDLKKESAVQLVTHLSSENNWWRETSQRLLVERGDASVVPALQELVTNGPTSMGKVHALWTLDGLHQLDEATVSTALDDKAPRVRATAIRLCDSFLKTGARSSLLEKLVAMTGEREPFVQQQLALTLGEAADRDADLAMAKLVQQAPETEFLVDAVASGLAGREASLLEKLVVDSSGNNKLVAALAGCVMASRRVGDIEKLIAWIASSKKPSALLDGALGASLRKPVKLANEPAALRTITDKRIARLSSLLVWPDKPGVKPEPPLTPLTKVQQARYDLGKVLFTGVCAACHQTHGKGLDGVAPPLMDSEWVLGSEQRIVRIVLHGLTGPISVKGKTYRLDMPAFGSFTDEQIAGILTYTRREWEHTADPVEPDTVQAIRAATTGRHEAWVQDQLRALP
jgi:mono/diheme cytochrome c family protein/glucose/arabinose dehydrogenase